MDRLAKMPPDLHALLKDMADIRREILEKAPQCLPAIAPAFVDAEQRIYAIWGN